MDMVKASLTNPTADELEIPLLGVVIGPGQTVDLGEIDEDTASMFRGHGVFQFHESAAADHGDEDLDDGADHDEAQDAPASVGVTVRTGEGAYAGPVPAAPEPPAAAPSQAFAGWPVFEGGQVKPFAPAPAMPAESDPPAGDEVSP